MKKIIILSLILCFMFSVVSYADKYAIKLKGGKIVSWQILSNKYLSKHGSDPSCPLQQGYILVDTLEGYEMYEAPPAPTEKERFLEMLEDEDVINKIKDKVKP